MAIELDEKELETLLTEVQGVVNAAVSEDLAKSEDKAEDKKEEEAKEVEKCGEMLPVKKEEEKPEAKEEAKEEEKKDMEKAEEPAESKEEKEEAKEEMKKDELPAEEKPAEEPAPEAPEAQEEEGEEDLDAKLAALDDDKLKHLYMACKKALFSRMSAQEEEAPAPAPEAPAAPEMEKAEEKAEDKKEEEKEELKEMKKSEEFVELQAQNELLQKALTLLATPLRKGITGISQVAPAKEEKDVTKMSKSEVIEVLNDKAAQENLKKSDRELINGYCLGLVSLDKVTHLLK